MAETEADIVVWDGGNNDFPFIRPDLQIAVADALRPAQVTTHHPGEAVARMADILIVNKVDAAAPEDVEALAERLRAVNKRAPIVRAASPVRLDNPEAVRGRRVLVIEDGPTITHGGMAHGAGYVAALSAGAAEIVDPRLAATSDIRRVYEAYPHIGPVLPAVGYNRAELAALEATINAAAADVVVAATPIDIGHLVRIDAPVVRTRYEFADVGSPSLEALVEDFLSRSVS